MKGVWRRKVCRHCGREFAFAEAAKHEVIIAEKPPGKHWKPIISGKAVNRYSLGNNGYIDTRKDGINYKGAEFYEGKHILLRQTGVGIYATMLGIRHARQPIGIHLENPQRHTGATCPDIAWSTSLAQFESHTMLYRYYMKSGDTEWRSFPRWTQELVQQLPIRAIDFSQPQRPNCATEIANRSPPSLQRASRPRRMTTTRSRFSSCNSTASRGDVPADIRRAARSATIAGDPGNEHRRARHAVGRVAGVTTQESREVRAAYDYRWEHGKTAKRGRESPAASVREIVRPPLFGPGTCNAAPAAAASRRWPPSGSGAESPSPRPPATHDSPNSRLEIGPPLAVGYPHAVTGIASGPAHRAHGGIDRRSSSPFVGCEGPCREQCTSSRSAVPLSDNASPPKILALLRNGSSRQGAAMLVGCAPSTITRTAAQDPAFNAELLQAERTLEVETLRAIRTATKEVRYWRAAAWMLERKNPDEFARRRPKVYAQAELAQLLAQLVVYSVQHVARKTYEVTAGGRGGVCGVPRGLRTSATAPAISERCPEAGRKAARNTKRQAADAFRS